MIRNNVHAAMTADRMRVSLDFFLLIEAERNRKKVGEKSNL